MKRHLVRFLLLIPVSIIFIAWYREPSGRGTAEPELPELKTIKDFDDTNPNPPAGAKKAFYLAVQAHLAEDFTTAITNYHIVLNLIENEPNTNYNLKQMK